MLIMSFLKQLEDTALLVVQVSTYQVLRGIYLGLDKLDLSKFPAERGCIYHFDKAAEAVLCYTLAAAAMYI